MKRKVFFILLLIILMLATSCSLLGKETGKITTSPSPTSDLDNKTPEPTEDPSPKETDKSPQETEPSGDIDDDDDPDPDGLETNPSPDTSPLDLVGQGRVEGIGVGAGDSTEKVISELGPADELDYYLGGLYLMYHDLDLVFFTSAQGQFGEITEHGEVVVIGISSENQDLYGVRLGMTFEQIIEVLGQPTTIVSAEENENSELLFDGWSLEYKVGDYTLCFQADSEDSQVYVAYLWVNDRNNY